MNYYSISKSPTWQVGNVAIQAELKGNNLKQVINELNVKGDDFPQISDVMLFELKKETYFTDMVSTIFPRGFLISEKFKEILNNHKLDKCEFYPAKLKYNNKELDYFWLHTNSSLIDYLDFPNSSFFISTLLGKKIDSIEIRNFADIELFRKEMRSTKTYNLVKVEEYKFIDAYSHKLDFFGFRQISLNSYFVSEKLRQDILLNDLSGVKTGISNISQ